MRGLVLIHEHQHNPNSTPNVNLATYLPNLYLLELATLERLECKHPFGGISDNEKFPNIHVSWKNSGAIAGVFRRSFAAVSSVVWDWYITFTLCKFYCARLFDFPSIPSSGNWISTLTYNIKRPSYLKTQG